MKTGTAIRTTIYSIDDFKRIVKEKCFNGEDVELDFIIEKIDPNQHGKQPYYDVVSAKLVEKMFV